MLEKFKLAIKREGLIYIVMLFVLTLVMHNDLLSNPSSRFEIMYEKGNYSHPFLYTFVTIPFSTSHRLNCPGQPILLSPPNISHTNCIVMLSDSKRHEKTQVLILLNWKYMILL